MRVAAYAPVFAEVWNDFVAKAKNGTFLHDRRYMDYHADRFPDRSLLVFDGDEPFAVIAACEARQEVVSHAGLTYGGMLLRPEVTLPNALRGFHAILCEYRTQGFTNLIYKQVPVFYHRRLCHEDEYALYLAGASLSRRETTLLVDQQDRLPFQARRERMVKKARKAGVSCRRVSDFGPYWHEVLIPNIRARFGVDPVHSLDEIRLLSRAWPDNIHLQIAERDGRIVAGAVVYLNRHVAHTQYISANGEGKEVGALDLLFEELLNSVYRDRRYFSFGTSNIGGGSAINVGLVDWKEGFGARVCSNDTYTIPLRDEYPLLEQYQ
jgi:hypothetical protein